ncbi:MAG: HAD family acid phosphatase [Pseudomonadota bacterium]
MTLLLCLALTACAAPLQLRWYRDSAEQRALHLQTYFSASEQLKTMRAGAQGKRPWAVVLDADETVLDNSDYRWQRRHSLRSFTEDSWAEWVKQAEARLLPGAAAFIDKVQKLGGLVVIITNRSESLCQDTKRNLEKWNVRPNALLCRPEGTGSSKLGRFHAVADGSALGLSAADQGDGAVQVMLYLGDNINDFPDASQALLKGGDAGFSEFGRRYFLLPNPMYGSWEQNPPRNPE